MRVSGHADPRACDDVRIKSPLAEVVGVIIGTRFYADAPLQSGLNPLQAICRRLGREVARSDRQLWRVPLANTPKAWIRTETSERVVRFDAGRTEPAPARAAPIVAYRWWARAGNPAPLRIAEGEVLDESMGAEGKHIEIAAPDRDGDYYVLMRASDALGRSDYSTAVFRVSSGRAQEVDLERDHPRWVDSAVLYGAAPYFFEPQNFDGVRKRLDEIAALGATAIWLSPVTTAASGDFGYAVTSHFTLREQFGGDAGFRALVDAAHRLGLRIIVDFVPNHFSDMHPYSVDAERNGARSPYYVWFDRNPGGEVTHYFDWKHLENLEYDNPQVKSYMTEAFARFLRDYHVDGFRADASWGVARRAPEFWPALRAELKRIDPDIFLLAEASAREPYHVLHGFDAAYDWTRNLGEWAWKGVFSEDGSVDLDRLRAALTNEGRGYPPDTLILRFLNNNDTGERFIARYGRRMTMLAATLEFTVPGVPLIYNGDEVGAVFQPYAEGPPIQWENDRELRDHYRRLAELRRSQPALQTREMALMSTDHDPDVLSYLRPHGDGDRAVLVVINFSGREIQVRPADAATSDVFSRFANATDLLTDSPFTLDASRPRLRIAAMSALVLAPRSP